MRSLLFVILVLLLANNLSFSQCDQPITADCSSRVQSQTNDLISQVEFVIIDTGDGGLSYEWYKMVGLHGCEGLGQFGSSITVPRDGEQYRCLVSVGNQVCQSFHFSAGTPPPPPPPPIPVNNFVIACGGGSSVLELQNNPNIYPQWKESATGNVLQTGAGNLSTGHYYELNSAATILRIHHGNGPLSFSFQVSNGNSSASVSLTLSVINVVPASINPTGEKKICSTCTEVLTASGGIDYTYQWKLNGSNIPNATNKTFNASQAGSYSVQAYTHGCNAGVSNTFTLTKNLSPTVDAGEDFLTYQFKPIILSGIASDPDGSIASYQWQQISGPNNNLGTIPQSVVQLPKLLDGTYVFRFTARDDFNESAADDVQITVKTVYNNYNNIVETVVNIPNVHDSLLINGLGKSKRSQTITYYDGLGRPMQIVSQQSSPKNTYDVIQPIVYDSLGREVRKYLPYVIKLKSNGWYFPDSLHASNYHKSEHYKFYNNATDKIADDPKPFSEAVLEPSPLNRILKQGAHGESWQPNKDVNATNDYSIKFKYESNGAEEVLLLTYNPINGLIYNQENGQPKYYLANNLSVTKTLDEHNNEVLEYQGSDGKTICKKVQLKTVNGIKQYAVTNYVYDELGSLVIVLSPEASSRLLSEYFHTNATEDVKQKFLNRWAFQYKYDSRKLMTEKKVPGAEWVYMVYDERERLVLTQDGNQRSKATKVWSFMKYDVLNRVITTGLKDTTAALSQKEMQAVVNNFYNKNKVFGERYIGNVQGNIHGYSNNTYPVVTKGSDANIYSYQTVTYYDNYDFLALTEYSLGNYQYVIDTVSFSELNVGIIYRQPIKESLQVVGQVTGTRVKVLDGGYATEYSYLNGVNYYDQKYRNIQSIHDNIKGGVDRITNVYDFTGRVGKSKTTHIQRDVTWKDRRGVLLVGNKLMRSSSSDAGAASEQTLPAWIDGWLEFTVSETATTRIIGLNDSNPDVSAVNIDYAFKLNGSTLSVLENNITKATVNGLKSGDILRIQRTGSDVKYYRNGIEITLTSPSAPSYTTLMVDVTFNTNYSTLVGIKTSFSTTSNTVTRQFFYDNVGRLTRTWHMVNKKNTWISIADNEYNDLGQLIDKKLYSTDGNKFKQSVDYRYNIRGWLTNINESNLGNGDANDPADYFGMELGYNKNIGVANSLLYNGNIAAVKWSNNLGLGEIKEKSYLYSYDTLNRLTKASFMLKGTTWATAPNLGFSESGYKYDLNGNIMALTRYDERGDINPLDKLVYNYGTGQNQSNRLLKVSDEGDDLKGFADATNTNNDYTYDDNGNMLTDQNKGITTSIAYNYLNLPEFIVRGGNNIRYIYDATGRKLTQLVTFPGLTVGVSGPQIQTDYVGEFIYENDVLQSILHDEGKVVLYSVKKVLSHSGETTTGITATNTTITTTTIGTEAYIKAISNGTTQRSGMFPVGSAISVQQGERYKIRVKGYRTKGTATKSNLAYTLVKVNGQDIDWTGAVLPENLPTASTESYAEQIITIPDGGTILEAGVVWDNVLAGEEIFLNEFEILKVENSAPEYQYNLKDHLGNVRLTFTTKNEAPSIVKATMENANEGKEQGEFLYYNKAVRVNAKLFDHTKKGLTNYAMRLNGTKNEQYGIAKSLSVMPGDTVRMEVFVKYVDRNRANWKQSLTDVLSTIASGAAPIGTVIDGGGVGSGGSQSFPFAGFLDKDSEKGTVPKAYLNYVTVDEKFNPVFDPAQTNYKRITEAAKEDGSNTPHERLFAEFVVKQPGYVYIYLSNDNVALKGEPVEVYFDDFEIKQVLSPVLSSQDYYPFGLTFNSYRRENGTPQDYKYNGKEEQTELGLGWLDYGARMYDPTIARWNGIDGMAEKYLEFSPYHYAANNPVRNYDIDGNEFTDAAWEWVIRMLNQLGGNVVRLNERIDNTERKLSKADISDKKKERLENRKERIAGRRDAAQNTYDQVFNEVARMDNSSQVYDVRIDPHVGEANQDKAATVYNVKNNRVDFVVSKESASLSLFAHEFKHGYQFETGQASLQVYNGRYLKLKGWLAYDFTDEVEAYERQKKFGNVPNWKFGYQSREVNGAKFPLSSSTMLSRSNSSHADLQNIANQNRQAFRLNSRTYAPTE
jgi:RHS repeat-associated protein